LFPAKERSNQFVPRNSIEITQRLKSAVLSLRNRSNECWLFPDPEPQLPPGVGRRRLS
jgi:hypothetical protein